MEALKARTTIARTAVNRRSPATEPRETVRPERLVSPAALLAGPRFPGRGFGPGRANTVLRLQSAYGNQAVQRLISATAGTVDRRKPPTIQRNGLKTFVEDLKNTSDLTTISVLIPRWDPKTIEDVATNGPGIARFKEMIFRLGEATILRLGPDALRAVKTIEDAIKLPGLSFAQLVGLAKGWSVPKPDVVAYLEVAIDRDKIDLSSAMSLASEHQAPFTERLRLAIAHFAPTIDRLLPYVEAASLADREAATKDSTLMSLAKSKLAPDDYLALLPALRTYNPPTSKLAEATGSTWISHVKGDEADKYIRAQLGTLVAGAVKAGRQVEGEMSVVGDADFLMAFRRQWSPYFGSTTDTVAKNVNAFVDVSLPKRHIWIHKDRGNAGTAVHEGMHKYASPTLRDELMKKYPGSGADAGISQLDEGITEYFTRKVTTPLGITRGNYANPFLVAQRLAARTSDTTLAAAYFDGALDGLKNAYLSATGKTMTGWEDFAKAVEEKRWADAVKLL